MLMLTLDVDSSIKNIVVPEKAKGSYYQKFLLEPNPNNRHLFQQGILLRLMGERISLYANSNEPEWLQQKSVLDDFLSKIEIKIRTRVHSECVDVMSFEQQRKSGVVSLAGYVASSNGFKSVDEGVSKLNPVYSKYIAEGLFDVFLANDKTFGDVCSLQQSEAKVRIKEIVDGCLGDSDNFTKDKNPRLTLNAARELITSLMTVFKCKIVFDFGADYFSVVKQTLLNNKGYVKDLTNKRTGLSANVEKLKSEQVENLVASKLALDNSLLRFGYFALRYLQMYVDLHKSEDKHHNCSSFGISFLDFKSVAGLKKLQLWLSDPSKAFAQDLGMNASVEFYKSAFADQVYAVSSSAPVLCRRYDGNVDIFVNSDVETEKYIKDRIMTSGCWNVSVGKKGLARLTCEPMRVPSRYWMQINDDVLDPNF